MEPEVQKPLPESGRVERAADEVLARRGIVAPVDVLLRLGWLSSSNVDMWRQGRLDCLEASIQANPARVKAALEAFREWALSRKLAGFVPVQVSRTRDRRILRFTADGSSVTEDLFATNYVSTALPPWKRELLVRKAAAIPDLVVIDSISEWKCRICGADDRRYLFMEGEGTLCLDCARLDHLAFLARGDADLTRRAKELSGLYAVVVRFSRARRRYERQGLLVEPDALERAKAGEGRRPGPPGREVTKGP